MFNRSPIYSAVYLFSTAYWSFCLYIFFGKTKPQNFLVVFMVDTDVISLDIFINCLPFAIYVDGPFDEIILSDRERHTRLLLLLFCQRLFSDELVRTVDAPTISHRVINFLLSSNGILTWKANGKMLTRGKCLLLWTFFSLFFSDCRCNTHNN